jgi:uncharacterized protein
VPASRRCSQNCIRADCELPTSEFRAVSLIELPKRAVLAGIRLYQWTLSPYLGRQCRFYPTCSHYALEAIEQHGLLRGGALSIRRLSRCHPFHAGGVDLVPAYRLSEALESHASVHDKES